jgi:hypothetical protein
MKILIFTEGTIIMHKNAEGLKRKEIIKQVKEKENSVKDYGNYIPIGGSIEKLNLWKKQGAEIVYLTSRKVSQEINQIKQVLKKHNFPKGDLFFRKEGEEYKDVAERINPDVLIEDDCESIGGIKEMTITFIKPKIKKAIKSIQVKEFAGISKLPNNFKSLLDKIKKE